MPNNMKTTIGIMFFLPLVCQRRFSCCCRRCGGRLIRAAMVTNRNTNTIDVDAAAAVGIFLANVHTFIC